MTEPLGVTTSETRPGGGILLAVRDLAKHFPIREGALQRIAGHVRAVDGVSFDIPRGATLGLVGESGCGKTTLGRLVAGLETPTAGGVYFAPAGVDLAHLDGGGHEDVGSGGPPSLPPRVDELSGGAWLRFRRNCQMVFQDSFSSLNPRQLVRDIVGRPLRVHGRARGSELTEQVVELLEQVGLGRQHLYRYPHQFSGGQRQRISIARALALDPEFIVLDEPTSALDVSVQAQILNLLHELQQNRGLTYLFITHDLSVVRHMADEIVVMYLGKVAEAGPAADLFREPLHPYTDALLRASPDVDAGDDGFRGLDGSVPDPARPPQGCRFHTRCPIATPMCGWEVDDVVRTLEDSPDLFGELTGVERRSEFDADLHFAHATAAETLASAIRDRLPPAMVAAIEALDVAGGTVTIRFRAVEPIELSERGPGRRAACVLDELP